MDASLCKHGRNRTEEFLHRDLMILTPIINDVQGIVVTE